MKQGIDPEIRKEIAKVGMTTTLAITVFTAPFLRGNKSLRKIHTTAGVALVGFSLWHMQLYQPPRKRIASQARSTAAKKQAT